MIYLYYRNSTDTYHDDLSIVIFCSLCINTWNNTNCFSNYWICVYLAFVSDLKLTSYVAIYNLSLLSRFLKMLQEPTYIIMSLQALVNKSVNMAKQL